jgi:hypothetical protein
LFDFAHIISEESFCYIPWGSTSVAGKVLSYSKSLKPSGWSWGGGGEGYTKVNSGFSRFGSGDGGMAMGNGGGSGILTHSSTVERLYAWEKKLFFEVKVGDSGFFAFSFHMNNTE